MPQIQGGANDLCIRRSLTRTIPSLAALCIISNPVTNEEQREKRDTCGILVMENRLCIWPLPEGCSSCRR